MDTLSILETLPITQWHIAEAADNNNHVKQLEQGKLLYFPQLAFELRPEERAFLSPDFVDEKSKNISFDSKTNTLKGARGTSEQLTQIAAMVARFSQQACALVATILPHYQSSLQVARTSFRPAQVSQRKMSYRKDDKRLHVDAFPASPNQGRRILRVFSNINPHGEDRVWRIGEPFEAVAKKFLPHIPRPLPGSSALLNLLHITRSPRTEYDHIMLQLHNRMKKDMDYQRQAPQVELRLPPGTTWIVQTDHVSHAAMSGQHLLEQTFYLPVEAMLDPQQSPLKILERLTGRKLA